MKSWFIFLNFWFWTPNFDFFYWTYNYLQNCLPIFELFLFIYDFLLPEVRETEARLPVMPDELLLYFLVARMVALARNCQIHQVSRISLSLIQVWVMWIMSVIGFLTAVLVISFEQIKIYFLSLRSWIMKCLWLMFYFLLKGKGRLSYVLVNIFLLYAMFQGFNDEIKILWGGGVSFQCIS